MAEISVRVLGTKLFAVSWATGPVVEQELEEAPGSGTFGQFELSGTCLPAGDEDAFGFGRG